MFCAECGTRLPETAKFCLECGHRREVVVATPTSPAASVSPAPATVDGWATDPARNVWLQPRVGSEEPISEKSSAAVQAGASTRRSSIEWETEREAADRRAASQRLRTTTPIGSLSRPTITFSGVSSRQRPISLTSGYLAIAAAVLVIVGSLGPWVSVVAPFGGSLSVSGTNGDGKITLCCGLLATVLLAFLVTSHRDGVWLERLS